jgi:hypothetical protein
VSAVYLMMTCVAVLSVSCERSSNNNRRRRRLSLLLHIDWRRGTDGMSHMNFLIVSDDRSTEPTTPLDLGRSDRVVGGRMRRSIRGWDSDGQRGVGRGVMRLSLRRASLTLMLSSKNTKVRGLFFFLIFLSLILFLFTRVPLVLVLVLVVVFLLLMSGMLNSLPSPRGMRVLLVRIWTRSEWGNSNITSLS